MVLSAHNMGAQQCTHIHSLNDIPLFAGDLWAGRKESRMTVFLEVSLLLHACALDGLEHVGDIQAEAHLTCVEEKDQ